jgi:hypothetical protein
VSKPRLSNFLTAKQPASVHHHYENTSTPKQRHQRFPCGRVRSSTACAVAERTVRLPPASDRIADIFARSESCPKRMSACDRSNSGNEGKSVTA